MSNTDELAHAIAGAGGGALLMVVTYPLVTLLTLAQTAKTKSGAVAAARQIVSQKGLLGLYSGLESALYGITLTNFIYYYFYELTSNVFLRANVLTKRRGLSTLQSIITGAVAGAITCVGSNPFWVANTRAMTAGKRQSTVKTIREIVQTDGVATLFAGVLPALVLVINPIIQYTIFEQIKNVILLRKGKFTPGKAFLIGALGKLIATFLTYPYITLKSRMHIKKKQEGAANVSMVQEIRNIVKNEGLEGLYGGLHVKLLQSISTAAFLFYFKEELLHGSVKLVDVLRLAKAKAPPLKS